MKKLVSCIIALTMFAGGLFCAQQTNNQKDQTISTTKNSRVFLGVAWNHLKEKRDSDKMAGNPYRLVAGYEYIKPNALYFFGRTEWGVGRSKGTLLSSAYRGYRHIFIIDGNVGWTFGFGQNNEFNIIPAVGIGYVNTQIWAYTPSYAKTNYYHWWIPVSLYATWDVIENLNIGVKGILFIDFDDHLTIKTGSNAGLSSKSKQELDWKVELPIKYNLSSDWAISLIPFYFKGKVEPKQNTAVFGTETKYTKIGGLVEIGYCF